MFRKTICLIMAGMLLCGCSRLSSRGNTSQAAAPADEAAELVSALNLSDMKKVKDRIVLGMVFDGDRKAYTEGTMYRSNDKSNADTVAVFRTEDPTSCMKYVTAYLSSQKDEIETNYPTEVFKVSNAVLESNDSMVVLVICENIENARKSADAILGISS